MRQRAGAPLAVGLWLRCVHPFQITPKDIQTDVKDQYENLPVNFLLRHKKKFGIAKECLNSQVKFRKKILNLQDALQNLLSKFEFEKKI